VRTPGGGSVISHVNGKTTENSNNAPKDDSRNGPKGPAVAAEIPTFGSKGSSGFFFSNGH
jgi:hypothetical protein